MMTTMALSRREVPAGLAGLRAGVLVHSGSLQTNITTQIVLRTDFPFGNSSGIDRGLQGRGFTGDEIRGIDRGNAVRILPKDNT